MRVSEWVSEWVNEWVSVSEGAGGGGRREAEGGYRTKSKNPTRQCGEKHAEEVSLILPLQKRLKAALLQKKCRQLLQKKHSSPLQKR